MSSRFSQNFRRSLLMVALLVAGLLLSGCFRQAGEEFNPESQPIGETVGEPTAVPSFTPEGAGADTLIVFTDEPTIPPVEADTEEANSAFSNSDLPPITVISPTRATFGQPSTLPEVESAQVTAQGGAQVFITPGVPMGPITITPPAIGTLPGGALTSTPSGLITPTSPVTLSNCDYTVESGDNLYQIGLANDATLEEMRAANPELEGENPILDIGQVLTLPNCTPGAELAVQPDDDEETTNTQAGSPQTSPPDAPAPPGSNSAPVGSVGSPDDSGIVGTGSNSSGVQTYTVQTGDTLFLIAQEFGTTVDEIIAVNDFDDPDRLDVGQVINLPFGA